MIEREFIIIPKKGFGHLKFGMFGKDVIKILGEPEEIEDPDEDGDVIFRYENRGITFLCFENEEKYRLTIIELNSKSNATLWGEKIFCLPFNQIKNLFKAKGSPIKYDFCVDDRETGDYQECYISKKSGFDFWFNKEKKLDEITFCVYTNENDQVEWPE